MKENFNPNKKVSITYVCPRTGSGMAIDVDKDPNYIQKSIAQAQIWDCEEKDQCPADCPMREIVKIE